MGPKDDDRPIVVRLDPASEPLEGTVQRPGEQAVAFVGYLQLVAQIERGRETAARRGASTGADAAAGAGK